MTTGRVAYMPSPGTVELREYEVPEPGPGAVLLKTLLAGVCGSEIHMFGGKHSVLSSVALGHEIVGEVAALGAGVDTDRSGEPLAVGDRVSVTYFRTCMACPACGRQEILRARLRRLVAIARRVPPLHRHDVDALLRRPAPMDLQDPGERADDRRRECELRALADGRCDRALGHPSW